MIAPSGARAAFGFFPHDGGAPGDGLIEVRELGAQVNDVGVKGCVKTATVELGYGQKGVIEAP